MSHAATPRDESLVITYGDMTHDFNTLPRASLVAMLRRGVSHFRGSEAASKVQAKIEKALTEAGHKVDEITSAEKKALIKGFRDSNADAVAAWVKEVQDGFTADLLAGDVGTSTRGPAVDPVTAIENRLLKAKVISRLKANKVAVPKKAEDKIAFPNGDSFTIADLVARMRNRPEDYEPIKKQAARLHAEQTRAAAQAEKWAQEAGGLDALL